MVVVATVVVEEASATVEAVATVVGVATGAGEAVLVAVPAAVVAVSEAGEGAMDVIR